MSERYLKDPFVRETLVPSLMGKRILITGACGFLGRNWVQFFEILNEHFELGLKVYAVDIVKDSNLNDNVTTKYKVFDVSKKFIPEEPIDYLIHAASLASPILYRRFPLETIRSNVHATEKILELGVSGEVRKILLLSTSEIYGNPPPEQVPTREDYVGNVNYKGPRACYDESKRLMETLSWIYANYYDVHSVTVRPFNVYGPGQALTDGRIIPDVMKSIVEDQKLSIFSNGTPKRTFCFLSDFIVGSVAVMLLGEKGEGYNLGNDKPEISISDLIIKVNQTLLELKLPPLKVEFKESTDPHYLTDNPQRRCPDIDKIRQLTGWEPKVSIEEGLKATISHYTRNR